jgi:hypothetical protein
MFLIMSAAYVGQELESEFGKIPPSFLPLGNRRLFQHQVKLAPKDTVVYLSIPESFKVSNIDRQWLDSNNVTLIFTADGLSLGASVVATLNLTEHEFNTPLHILFGDTLFTEIPTGDDIVGISNVKDSYNWAFVTNDDLEWIKESENQTNPDSNNVVNGYFKFSKPRQLIRNITQSNWHFLDGLNRYHTNIGLTTVKSDCWLDFGHVNTYYRSKAEFTTQRAFNELLIDPKWIEKSSSKSIKIEAEANWFASIPAPLRNYIPQFLGANYENDSVSYRLEYLHQTALNELFVFGELPTVIWQQIINRCLEFIIDCRKFTVTETITTNTLDELFINKTKKRLDEFCQSKGISSQQVWYFNSGLSISIQDILKESQKYLPSDDLEHSVLHGDFCFSNILYDFRAGRLKTIDPRGLSLNNELTIYGDTRYDLAKLSHSILGMYDWIVAGYYTVEIKNKCINFEIAGIAKHKATQQLYIDLIGKKFGLSALNLYAMQIQLFLSMLPLHADDSARQDALLANVFRLYQILERVKQ